MIQSPGGGGRDNSC